MKNIEKRELQSKAYSKKKTHTEMFLFSFYLWV